MRSALTRFISLSSLPLALTACSADPEPEPPAPLVLEVGTGIDDYVPVSPEQRLLFTQGLQGGYHIFTSVRALDVEPWDAQFEFEMYQGDVQIGGARYRDDFVPRGDAHVFSGVTVFLFADYEPEDVAGRATRIIGRVTDAEGRTGEAEMRFVSGCCEYLP